jgi:hypothetical protein
MLLIVRIIRNAERHCLGKVHSVVEHQQVMRIAITKLRNKNEELLYRLRDKKDEVTG